MASAFQQITAVTAMNLRSIPSRLGTSMVVVIGIAGVVGVMVALLSMSRGFSKTLEQTGRADRALIMRGGSNDELSSVVRREHADIILSAPGVKKGADGRPLGIGESYLVTALAKLTDPDPNNVVVRGTSARILQLRPEVRIAEGRMFTPGLREVVAGRSAVNQFADLSVGSQVEVRDGLWTVVGIFESGGDVHESEIWVDTEALMAASRRTTYSSMTVQLESEDAFTAFKDALSTDPRLSVSVQREPAYYASRANALGKIIKALGYAVAVIMGIGALFGALNTMYAAVATRTVEIATLRAIGFNEAPVVVSVMLEALVLALAGGLIGGICAYYFFNGYSVSALNIQTFSQVAFAFRVTPDLLWQGLLLATLIGLIGGLFPAVRAARIPVVEALRAI